MPTTSERWREIKEIVATALELPPAERSEFIDLTCGADTNLRSEVESLLTFGRMADPVLEDPPVLHAIAPGGGQMIGRRLGPWTITREAGSGGMAFVYEAERTDGEYRMRVAIKIVRPAADGASIARRLRQERQTLAALEHPYIVRLLDGGTTSEGWPYIVMDFVDGVPIDDYCRQHRLSVAERLRLFVQICSAVHYAHEHKVVHRDLKPHNILITKDGVPRLLDFGIAKVLDPNSAAGAQTLGGDLRAMTPEYASPEQVRGQPITPATDVYLLGVLLYELLSGQLPYTLQNSTWPQIAHAVCEQVPEKPSEAARRTTPQHGPQTGSAAEAARSEELARLGTRLRGDLDTIIMAALRKEPARRYASVAELSQDIERHLAGLPIRARRASWGYVAGRFVRRHREAAAATAMGLVLAGGVALWESHALTARTTPRIAQGTAARTRPAIAVLGFRSLSQTTDSRWVSTALAELLASELAAGEQLRVLPGEAVARARTELALPDETTFARDTLTRVRRDLGADFVVSGSYLESGSGELRVELRLQDTATGAVLDMESQTASSAQLLEVALRAGARLRMRLGVRAASAPEVQQLVAAVPASPEGLRLYSEGLQRLRQFDALGARDQLQRAAELDAEFPMVHAALARAWQTLGYDASAEAEAKRAMQLASRLSREDRLLVEARYFEAAQNWRQAIETYAALFRFFPDNLDYALALAAAQTAGGRARDALTTLSQLDRGPSIRLDARVELARSEAASALGDDRLRSDAAERAAAQADSEGAKLLVARARTQQCRALADLGEDSRALAACEVARRIYSEAGDRAGLARTLHSMAEVPLDREDLVTAEHLYQQALALTREIGDQRGIGRALGNLALIYKLRGNFVAALDLNQQALQIDTEAGDRANAAVWLENIGDVLLLQGKTQEALRHYRDSLAVAREVGQQVQVALDLSAMADALTLTADLNGAAGMYHEALTTLQSLGQRYYYADTLVALGKLLVQRDELPRARATLQEALGLEQQLGDKGQAAQARSALASLDCEAGEPVEAESLARQAVDTFATLKETDHQVAAQTVLARALLIQGRLGEAQELIGTAQRGAAASADATVTLALALARAEILAASADWPAASRVAVDARTRARRSGFVTFELEADLVRARIFSGLHDTAASRRTLEHVAQAAHRAGLELIARKASSQLI